MQNEDRTVQGDENGRVGTGVRPLSDLRTGDEDRRDMEAHNIYGKIGEEILRSISKIDRFDQGYPRRITLGKEEKGAAAWNKFYEWQYQQLCRIHNIIPEPKQETLL